MVERKYTQLKEIEQFCFVLTIGKTKKIERKLRKNRITKNIKKAK